MKTSIDMELEIAKELTEIVPTWQKVDLTKKGYNQQWVRTIYKLVHYTLGKMEQELLRLPSNPLYVEQKVDARLKELANNATSMADKDGGRIYF